MRYKVELFTDIVIDGDVVDTEPIGEFVPVRNIEDAVQFVKSSDCDTALVYRDSDMVVGTLGSNGEWLIK